MIAENGAEDAAFLPRGRLSPDDETARSRIARSLFVLSTRGLDAFVSPEGRFRDGRAGATPWAGVGADDGGARRSRQASAARTAATAPIALGAMPARPFSWSEKQEGTPQLPQISVPRDAPQNRASDSKGRSRSDAEGARQRPRGFRAFRGRKQRRTGLSADRISGFQKIGISLYRSTEVVSLRSIQRARRRWTSKTTSVHCGSASRTRNANVESDMSGVSSSPYLTSFASSSFSSFS